jgi:hypothetical protein
MSLILKEDGAIGFLNKRFSILGEGEKSCQVVSRGGFIGRHTLRRFLVGLALQGIGFMNIIPYQFVAEFSTAGLGFLPTFIAIVTISR